MQAERAAKEQLRAHHQAEVDAAVQVALAEAAERHAAELSAMESTLQAAPASDHTDGDPHRLHLEAHAAAEELANERSRVAALEATVEDLRGRWERAEAAVAALTERGNAVIDLENELMQARTESAVMREEVARLRLDLSKASASTTVSADDAAPDAAGHLAAAQEELGVLRSALATAEAERSSLKQQLTKLKAQMLGDQDDEEEKIKWRVDAEVKLALEKMGIGPGDSTSGLGGDRAGEARLRTELEAALEAASRAEEAATRWERTATARDAELANMQRALGELSYESDAAERLRAELRALQAEVHALRNELDASKLAKIAAEGAAQQAQADVAAGRAEVVAAREAEAAAQREVLEARVALHNTQRELKKLQGSGVLERALVLQALAGIAGLKRPREGVTLAAR